MTSLSTLFKYFIGFNILLFLHSPVILKVTLFPQISGSRALSICIVLNCRNL